MGGMGNAVAIKAAAVPGAGATPARELTNRSVPWVRLSWVGNATVLAAPAKTVGDEPKIVYDICSSQAPGLPQE
jgi:hypothetical protein